jgi:signal peptidase I
MHVLRYFREEVSFLMEDKKVEKIGWQKNVVLYLHDLMYMLITVMLLFLLLFRVIIVSGDSMRMTLIDGDYLLLLGNVLYQNPQYGDVIVASKDSFDNGAPIVKRVIATEGQWVDIDFIRGVVRVSDDGMQTWKELDEPYTHTPTNIQEGVTFPLKVEEGCLFVMGDNRNGSKDSRSPEIGLIDKREVLGKVIFLFLPGTNGTDIYGQPNEPRDFGRIGVVN